MYIYMYIYICIYICTLECEYLEYSVDILYLYLSHSGDDDS